MRISDWSSDVCSSDLAAYYSAINHDGEASAFWKLLRATLDDSQARVDIERAEQVIARRKQGQTWAERSEEHTSELQSLMRISYAVFCLNKKKYVDHKKSDTPSYD